MAVKVGQPFEPEPGHAGGGKRRGRARRLQHSGRDTMSGTSKRTQVDEARLAGITTGPFPRSRKTYVQGSQYPFLRVPMREIDQTATRPRGEGTGETPNPPVSVYDTSGPYTDADARVDVRHGLAPLRAESVPNPAQTPALPLASSPAG